MLLKYPNENPSAALRGPFQFPHAVENCRRRRRRHITQLLMATPATCMACASRDTVNIGYCDNNEVRRREG